MNSTNRGRFCPVLSLLAVAASVSLIAVSACGSEDGQQVETGNSSAEVPALSQPEEVSGFLFRQAPPDTHSVSWLGEGPATVETISVRVGDDISIGDTLLTVSGDINTVLLQRLEMELQVARARMEIEPGDSILSLTADSLNDLLDSLVSMEDEALESPLQGTVTAIIAETGDRVIPGDRLLLLAAVAGDVYTAYAPEELRMTSWPQLVGVVRLLSHDDTFATYSADPVELEGMFDDIRAIERTAIFENELSSYVITEEGDTISVRRLGEMGAGYVIVLPERPINGAVLTWREP